MTVKPPETRLADPKPDPQQLSAEIGKHVIRKLGRPGRLYQVQVRTLWPEHYRVNVFVGESASIKIAHSYFLVADSDGNVVESVPGIIKQY